jgi:hypothetical protein
MPMKNVITAAAVGTIVASSEAHAVLGVGDIVSDPIVEEATVQKNIFDQIKYAWEQTQWADKLATLHNTLMTVRENLEVAIRVKNAIGDPSQIVGLDEALLDGTFSETGITQTFQELGGLVAEGATVGTELKILLGQPISLNAWMNAGRQGGFRALTYNPDPLAKYRAVEYAYQRYNTQLQISSARAQQMRTQIRTLQTRLGTATTDAETQKIQGSLISADAALEDLEGSIRLSSDQINIARTLAENRRDQEIEAYNATVNQMNQEVEANLELPVEEIATVTPNF